MRIHREDLKRAHDACLFMSVVDRASGKAEQWNSLVHAIDRVLGRSAEDGDHVDAVWSFELAQHSGELACAMREHWMEWADLARKVAAKRGWISKEHQAEFGNANREAAAIREAAEFLHAALASVTHARAA